MPGSGWGAADAARQLEDPVLKATGVAAYARAAALAGGAQQAQVACTEAAALVDALVRRLDAAVHLAGGELYRHRFTEAGAHAERALAVGRGTGHGQLFPLIYAILGMAWLVRGRLANAVEPLDGAIEAARTTGNAQTLAWSLHARSMVALAAGDVETALATGQEAFDVTEDGKPSHVAGWAAFVLAGALLQIGKPERAVELLERSTGGPDMPRTAPTWRSYALELLTRCRLALGQIESARRAVAVAAAVVAADAVQLPLAKASADRVGAAVALEAGDPSHAAELALASAAGADDVGVPVEAALARTVAGRALAQHGDRDRAADELERAASALDLCGALRYRDAAEREPRQLGRHIHRRSQPAAAADGGGVGSLTKRELEIARLVVARRTNREIAETLFLSPQDRRDAHPQHLRQARRRLPRRGRPHRRTGRPARSVRP